MIIKFTPKKEKTSMERIFKPVSGPYLNSTGKTLMQVIPKSITTHDMDIKNDAVIIREAILNDKTKKWELNLNKK